VTERDNLPRWDGRRGRYEAWFLTVSRGREGYWIRATVRAPVAGPPEPRLWFARFDRDDPSRIFGINAPATGLRVDPRVPGVVMGESHFGSGESSGTIDAAGGSVSWDLRWETGDATWSLLPPALARVAPTRPLSPNPHTAVAGEIVVDGERVILEGAPGQQGHLYGGRHASRWAWVHAADPASGLVVQAVSASGRIGPVPTPYLTFAGVRLDGEWTRLRGRGRSWGLGWWRIDLASRRHRLVGEVSAPAKHLLRARYLDPDDTPRWCHNSEVASARLTLLERTGAGWREAAELRCDGTAHAEWAGRTPARDVDARHVPAEAPPARPDHAA